MKRRPWILIAIAWANLLLPVFLLWVVSILAKMPFRLYDRIFFHAFGWVAWSVVFIFPLALAICIFAMKRWSYIGYIVFLGLDLALNMSLMFRYQSNIFSILNILYLGFGLVVVSYFLIPQVRRVYFDPRVRWWENQPRYTVRQEALISILGESQPGIGKTLACIVEDLSEGGCFVSVDKEGIAEVPSRVQLELKLCGLAYTLSGRVLHKTQRGDRFFFGTQFEFSTPDEKDRLLRLTTALRIMGCKASKRAWPRLQELSFWFGVRSVA
jgi:hypothetical protein